LARSSSAVLHSGAGPVRISRGTSLFGIRETALLFMNRKIPSGVTTLSHVPNFATASNCCPHDRLPTRDFMQGSTKTGAKWSDLLSGTIDVADVITLCHLRRPVWCHGSNKPRITQQNHAAGFRLGDASLAERGGNTCRKPVRAGAYVRYVSMEATTIRDSISTR
jgi:hypothetical protein